MLLLIGEGVMQLWFHQHLSYIGERTTFFFVVVLLPHEVFLGVDLVGKALGQNRLILELQGWERWKWNCSKLHLQYRNQHFVALSLKLELLIAALWKSLSVEMERVDSLKNLSFPCPEELQPECFTWGRTPQKSPVSQRKEVLIQ